MLGEKVKATVIPSDDSLKEGRLCMLLEGMCRRKSPQIPSLTPRCGGEGGEKASGLHCSCMCLRTRGRIRGVDMTINDSELTATCSVYV